MTWEQQDDIDGKTGDDAGVSFFKKLLETSLTLQSGEEGVGSPIRGVRSIGYLYGKKSS